MKGDAKRYSNQQKVADASALGLVAGSNMGTADAQEIDYSGQLDLATQSLEATEGRISTLQDQVALLESALDPNGIIAQNPDDSESIARAKAVQGLLDARGFDLGEYGADGRIGKVTRAAINNNIVEIKKEIQTNRQASEEARKTISDLNMQITHQQIMGGEQSWLDKNAPWLGTALGLAIATGSRGGGRIHQGQKAKQLERRANALLNPSQPVSRAKTGPNALNDRAANLNEFWNLGGAKSQVPFKKSQKGKWSPHAKKDVKDVYSLYGKPSQFNALDASVMGAGAVEQHVAGEYVKSAKADLEDAEARAEAALKAGNQAAYQQALSDQKRAQDSVTFWTGMQRMGQAAMVYAPVSALKIPYREVRPNFGAAQNEHALLLEHMARGKSKPKPNKGSK
jgi:hypothetical protein